MEDFNEDQEVSNVVETVRIDDKDWFLQMLVGMANDGLGISITLNVGGLLVSGNLVSGKDYLIEFGEVLSKSLDPENGENAKGIRESYQNMAEDVYGQDESKSAPPVYLHMKNAKYFSISGDSLPSNDEVSLWRGRISEVGGFSLGSFSKNKG